jgi:hypothetical protein
LNLQINREASWAHSGSEPHLRTVELTQFGPPKEDTVNVFIHLFESDFFVAEDFTDEDSAFVPTDVSAVVDPSGLE